MNSITNIKPPVDEYASAVRRAVMQIPTEQAAIYESLYSRAAIDILMVAANSFLSK